MSAEWRVRRQHQPCPQMYDPLPKPRANAAIKATNALMPSGRCSGKAAGAGGDAGAPGHAGHGGQAGIAGRAGQIGHWQAGQAHNQRCAASWPSSTPAPARAVNAMWEGRSCVEDLIRNVSQRRYGQLCAMPFQRIPCTHPYLIGRTHKASYERTCFGRQSILCDKAFPAAEGTRLRAGILSCSRR